MSEPTTSRWTGKVAVVTGASSGIGRAIAWRLAQDGMRVAALARRIKRVDSLARDAAYERLPGELTPYSVDLRDEGQVLEMFRAVRAKWGGVDVLVNAAGLGRASRLTSGRTEDWREMLEVNVLALSVCTREAIKDMLAREVEGHVIHIGSMSGYRVPNESGIYSATKFAVRALTEALRQELRALHVPIRVSSISPGYVETEFAELYHGSKEAAQETYGRFQVLQATDVADTLHFVLNTPPHVQIHDIQVRPTEQPT